MPDLLNPKKSIESSRQWLPPYNIERRIRFSIGLLAGSGPSLRRRASSHWHVPLSRTRRSKSPPITTDTLAVPIAVATTAMDMAKNTIGQKTAMATDGPMVMDMGVAGVHSRHPSSRGSEFISWRNLRQGRIPRLEFDRHNRSAAHGTKKV